MFKHKKTDNNVFTDLTVFVTYLNQFKHNSRGM